MTGFVLLGFLAGDSYDAVARTAARDITAVVAGVAVIGLIIWRVRKARREARALTGSALEAEQ